MKKEQKNIQAANEPIPWKSTENITKSMSNIYIKFELMTRIVSIVELECYKRALKAT